MAKGTRGGKRGSAAGGSAAIKNQVTPPTTQQVAQGNVLPAGGVAFSEFQNMTDDEKAQVVKDALNTGVPLFLEDSGIQRFAYFTGMSDKPTTVSDSQLDKMSGVDLYRTVNDAYSRDTDIGYTSNDIYRQIKDGDFTMYSDSGGSAHGKAIYFAADYGDSAIYSGAAKDHPLMMRAKVTSGGTIDESKLDAMYNSALGKGDKLAKACSRADRSSARNLYALAKGYSVITPTYGTYYMVLNRGALSMSDKTVKDPYGQRRWK